MRQGFTLLETILVLALMMTLAGVGTVVLNGIVRSQSVANVSSLVASHVHVAQTFSYTQTDDVTHGVKIFADRVVRFEGETYDTRDTTSDVVTSFPAGLTVSGDDEIVFVRGTAAPATSTSTVIESTNREYTIHVSVYGVIDVQ